MPYIVPTFWDEICVALHTTINILLENPHTKLGGGGILFNTAQNCTLTTIHNYSSSTPSIQHNWCSSTFHEVKCNFMRQFRMLITLRKWIVTWASLLGIFFFFYYFYLRFFLFLLFILLLLWGVYGMVRAFSNWRWIYALARSYYICASVHSGRRKRKRGRGSTHFPTLDITMVGGGATMRQTSGRAGELFIYGKEKSHWKALK